MMPLGAGVSVSSVTLPARSSTPYGLRSPGVVPTSAGLASPLAGWMRAGDGDWGPPHGKLRRGIGFFSDPSQMPPRNALVHWSLLGSFLPWNWQYARAWYQVMPVTGLALPAEYLSSGAGRYVGNAMPVRSDISANTSNSAFDTSMRSISNAGSSTSCSGTNSGNSRSRSTGGSPTPPA